MSQPPRNIEQTIAALPEVRSPELPTPAYHSSDGPNIMLAAEVMRTHTADAGWQLTKGMEHAGYELWGMRLPNNEVDTQKILEQTNPSVCVVQDKREWEGETAQYRRKDMRFENIEALKERSDIFKLTVLKDAQQRPAYHRQSAEEIGVHAWVTYYHPRIVKHVAPYVRTEHLLRTYHSIDAMAVPKFQAKRRVAFLSGAVSNAYPLRKAWLKYYNQIAGVEYYAHPGYHNRGCLTPDYLKRLSQYKIAICTSSRYGYSLRKIIEATVCGCVVITDLPTDDVLPEIDENLVRVSSVFDLREAQNLIRRIAAYYSPERQQHFAERAKSFYDWRVSGIRLANAIDLLKNQY